MPSAATALLDRLHTAKKISPEQYESLRLSVERDGVRAEDALVEQGAMEEEAMLKYVAGLHKTRFVSTDKLSKATIDGPTLGLIPRAMAEESLIFPVVFNAKDKSLAIVAADPGNTALFEQVRLAAGVGAVKPYAARPAGIRAAIQKHYAGDIHAFAKLDRAGYDQFTAMLDVYERNLLTEEGMNASGATTGGFEQEFSGEELGSGGGTLSGTMGGTMSGTAADAGGVSGIAHTASIEIANVLVSLLETQRAELRGHSAQVSRLMALVGEHIGLPPADVYALRLAGLLHDVGKTSSYHLTSLNVAEYEGHRAQALKAYLSPSRLFEAAELPGSCVDGLNHMYERFDGSGFPDRRAGKDIPLSARLLAIAETYADLTTNARNPFRKTLTPKAAVDVLGRYKETLFDANLVDLFRVAALGEDLQSKLLNDRPRVILVDSDVEETTVLELRMVEQGNEVLLCRDASQAFKMFKGGNIDAMIVEVELKPHDGFALVEHIRKQPKGADLPVLFLTSRSDRASVDRGFELGAVDYIIKPASADVVVAKARNALAKAVRQRGSRGVSGSLSEMPLPDVLQVLARTRKTGRLKIAAGGYVGEIHFCNGDIYNAMFMRSRGEEAIYTLLQLEEGEFALDPGFTPETREVNAAVESLLLEGMRRWDEQQRTDLGSTQVE